MNASANVTKTEKKPATNVQSSTEIPLQVPSRPRRQTEFQEFLRTLKTPGVKAHWQEVAQALGVDPNTISDWLKLPEAIAAKQEGIRLALEGMQMSGASDWKMHQAKLRMLNVKTNEVAEGGGNVTNNTLIVMADALKAIAGKEV